MTIVVLISANNEWKAVNQFWPRNSRSVSPYGQWFPVTYTNEDVLFMQSGWGKVSAAASTQYAINHWQPTHIINLGTCGGFTGEIDQDEIILANKTVIYDIVEKMGDPEEAISHYTTNLDISWLSSPYPHPVHTSCLASADRDLSPDDIVYLKEKFGASAADWESGAIAWVANRNNIPCLILRGVSDIVSEFGSPAYGDIRYFQGNAGRIMNKLLNFLPDWINILKTK